GYILLRNLRNLRLKNSCQFVAKFFSAPSAFSAVNKNPEIRVNPWLNITEFSESSVCSVANSYPEIRVNLWLI
ncbi:unnamed protein product, partial [marine sediment metagenome]